MRRVSARRPRDLDRAAVGSWVKTRREAKSWRQTELAEFYGVTQSAISLIEQGRRAIAYDRFLDLCAVFAVDPVEAIAEIEAIAQARNQ